MNCGQGQKPHTHAPCTANITAAVIPAESGVKTLTHRINTMIVFYIQPW